jgi:hypothetical protein
MSGSKEHMAPGAAIDMVSLVSDTEGCQRGKVGYTEGLQAAEVCQNHRPGDYNAKSS